MPKRPPPTFENFLRMPDGSVKPFSELTPEELDDWDRRKTHRMSRIMSEYYRLHPEEAETLQEVSPERKKAFYERFPEFKQKNRRISATTP